MTAPVAVGLGSNIGDRAAHLAAAVAALVADVGRLAALSSLYETAPLGGIPQGDYLNAVAVVDADLPPREVLDCLLAIERHRGRERRERWGPRTLDLDLLLYGAAGIDEPGLTVPHPAMAGRRFVLEPLVEAWPDAAIPGLGPAASLLPAVAHQGVRRVSDAPSGSPPYWAVET